MPTKLSTQLAWISLQLGGAVHHILLNISGDFCPEGRTHRYVCAMLMRLGFWVLGPGLIQVNMLNMFQDIVAKNVRVDEY